MDVREGLDTSCIKLLGLFPVTGSKHSRAELALDLPELASRHDAYACCIAAFLVCLRKYGEEAPVLCTASTPRVLPFSCEPLPEQSFVELVSQLHETLTQSQEPDPAPPDDVAAHFCLSESDPLSARTHAPLRVQFFPSPDGLHVVLYSYADSAAQPAAERFLASFGHLLRAALANPTQPIRGLRALSEQSRSALIARFEGRRVAGTTAPDVLERFLGQVSSQGESLALLHGSDSMTYAALWQHAERLASRLHRLEIREGDVVGIWADRTPGTVIALLATLRLGACCLTIDPALPDERVRYLLDSSRARLVVGDASRAVLGSRLPILPAIERAGHDAELPAMPPANPERAFCILYTSGSTGRPKGVRLPHRTFANLIAWHIAAMPFASGARTLQFASLSFDVSLQEIFSTLCAGGTLVLLPAAADQKNPSRLLSIIQEYRVERIFMPFVALQQLAKAAYDAQQPLVSLRQVVTGGEQLRVTRHITWLFTSSPNARLYNHYGPTETHVVTSFALPDDPSTWPALPPIGSCIDNAAIYLLDPDLDLAPQDAIGEVYIAGTSVALDYVGEVELTRARFIEWGDDDHVPGLRLYRTGDLAYADAKGQLCFVRRRDTQVKVRGFRFEPAELEAALCQHKSVADAAAVVVFTGDDSGDARIFAFVVASGATPYERELRRFVAARLPAFALPSRIVCLDAFPRTATGKVDRLALKSLATTSTRAEGSDAASTQGVRQLWVDQLRHSDFGPTDSFFDVGGNSLMALGMLNALRERYGVSVDVEEFLQQPTVRALEVLVGNA